MHSAIGNLPCRNLDLVLCGAEWVKNSFHGYGGNADLVIVEGVMGLFDGIGRLFETVAAPVVATVLGGPATGLKTYAAQGRARTSERNLES